MISLRTYGFKAVRAGALLYSVLMWVAPASGASDLKGKVVAVADGDTLTILDANKRQHRIRLAEIDAPERGLCFGRHAEVRRTDTDRYKRVVSTVSCVGVNANAELVHQGMAWVYVQY